MDTWLWIGFAGMVLGAGAIAGVGRKSAEDDRHHAVASFFVCLIAAASYFAMANGQGVVEIGDRVVYYARYVDWMLTTPLLLLGLLMVGLPALRSGEDSRTRTALVAGVIGADVFMIVTGLIASLSADDTLRYVWYVISCGAFLAIVALMWGPVRAAAIAQGPDAGGLYQRLLVILTALWFVYPVLWLLGTEGADVIGLTGEVAVFAVIDVTAKAVFGLLLVTGVNRLPSTTVQRARENGRTTDGAARTPASRKAAA